MNSERTQITLTLEGERAKGGVSLSDFESFIDNFLAALRDFERHHRGAQTRKSGKPEQRAAAATAFRLVNFKKGSGIATLEPEQLVVSDDDQLVPDEDPLSLVNLRALVADFETGVELPGPVTDSLGKACRVFGSDGSVEIDDRGRKRRTMIDTPSLERFDQSTTSEAEVVRSVSGRLHLLDIEPDKLAIRTSSGMDWTCKYPEELEATAMRLVNQIVWAVGSGRVINAERGSMTIERIEEVEQGEQTALFTPEPTPDAELLDQQGIEGPQGLAAIGDPEWNEETDDVYLEALTGQ